VNNNGTDRIMNPTQKRRNDKITGIIYNYETQMHITKPFEVNTVVKQK